MCNQTCGDCYEFTPVIDQCLHPMVYLNHESDVHKTTATTEACGFFNALKPSEKPVTEK